QHGPDSLIALLCKIFRASLALGYILVAWRTAKVVFIPKAGRYVHIKAKDYRAICLTSFLLKILEKIINRYIHDEILMENPLHKNQHAYLLNKGTETALHQLVTQIERSLENGEITLG